MHSKHTKLSLLAMVVVAGLALSGCSRNQTTSLPADTTINAELNSQASVQEESAKMVIESQESSDLEAVDATLDSLEASFRAADSEDIADDLSGLE